MVDISRIVLAVIVCGIRVGGSLFIAGAEGTPTGAVRLKNSQNMDL